MRAEVLPKIRGEYRLNYNLSHLTWFKTGGNAQVFFKPLDTADLISFLQNIDREIPILIIGNCSNTIIRDGGIEGVVIKLGRNFANIRLQDNDIIVGAGALNSSVAQFAIQNNIANFEFLIGIPGTIGGGIRMNAGSYGSEFKYIVKTIKAVKPSGEICEFMIDDNLFGYRKCNLQEDLIFLEARLGGQRSTREIIKAKMDKIIKLRAESQPITEKTSGSTFANPATYSAWKLIEEVGLRGFAIGGAQFSKLHCNFLINTGNATSKDLEDLGEMARKKVKETRDINLNWEIKIVGKHSE